MKSISLSPKKKKKKWINRRGAGAALLKDFQKQRRKKEGNTNLPLEYHSNDGCRQEPLTDAVSLAKAREKTGFSAPPNISNIFINYKRENSNSTVHKPSRHHLNWGMGVNVMNHLFCGMPAQTVSSIQREKRSNKSKPRDTWHNYNQHSLKTSRLWKTN